MNYVSKYLVGLCVGLLFFVAGITNALAGTPHDGGYYFDTMKDAMLEVVKENQKLINSNPDGSVKNKKLTPDVFYKNTMLNIRRCNKEIYRKSKD